VIDRRVFIGAAASALITIPFAAPAQQKDKVRHIGILAHGEPPTLAENQETWAPARELGWIEGRNLIVEGRYAKGQAELLRPFAEELVRLNVEIIVTQGTDATLAAKNATSSIPIVFISVGDPVAAGLVASLARPGGNITGLSLGAQGVDAKRLSLLRELLPGVQRVGDLENPNNPFFRLARNYEEHGVPFARDSANPYRGRYGQRAGGRSRGSSAAGRSSVGCSVRWTVRIEPDHDHAGSSAPCPTDICRGKELSGGWRAAVLCPQRYGGCSSVFDPH
jgi:hypothetical protein